MSLKTIIEQVQQEIEATEKKLLSLKTALAKLQETANSDVSIVPVRAPRGQRIKQVQEFLSKGPALKNEIGSTLGIPIGTLDSVLNRKDLFSLQADGKWSLKK